MPGYVKVRDELGEANLEVQELTRLLQEAENRRDYILSISQTFSLWESILHYLGFQIKSN
tara:strand:- start:134 stop:313 length:180 start_codon:yes stop_codon:yes gene_type:complete